MTCVNLLIDILSYLIFEIIFLFMTLLYFALCVIYSFYLYSLNLTDHVFVNFLIDIFLFNNC